MKKPLTFAWRWGLAPYCWKTKFPWWLSSVICRFRKVSSTSRYFFNKKEQAINFHATYSTRYSDFGVVMYVFQNHMGLLTSPKSHTLCVHFSWDVKSAPITKNDTFKQIFIFFKHRPRLHRASYVWHCCQPWWPKTSAVHRTLDTTSYVTLSTLSFVVH